MNQNENVSTNLEIDVTANNISFAHNERQSGGGTLDIESLATQMTKGGKHRRNRTSIYQSDSMMKAPGQIERRVDIYSKSYRNKLFTNLDTWSFREKTSAKFDKRDSILFSPKKDDEKDEKKSKPTQTFEKFRKYKTDKQIISKSKVEELQKTVTTSHVEKLMASVSKSQHIKGKKSVVNESMNSIMTNAQTNDQSNMSSVIRFRQHTHDKKQLLNLDDDLKCCLKLRTSQSVRVGMKKAALDRHKKENLGMVSFNKTRQMFPTKLNHEKELDFMFECSPHLLQFKRDDTQLEKLQAKNNSKGQTLKTVNQCYKDSQGNTHGLYQRFYWDSKDTVFGGTPGFKAQGCHGPGKYLGQTMIRSSKNNGGKFSNNDNEGPAPIGPTPTQYFGLGRSEINPNTGNKLDRQRRVLPGEAYVQRVQFGKSKPFIDNNNTLYHADKGRGAPKTIKGNKFTEGKQGHQIDPPNAQLPGPGAYQTVGAAKHTTAQINAPAYSLSTAGQLKIQKQEVIYVEKEHKPSSGQRPAQR